MKTQRSVLKHLKNWNASVVCSNIQQSRPFSISSVRSFQKKPAEIKLLTKSYCHGLGDKAFVDDTVCELLQKTVESTPDVECLVFNEDGIRVTFEKLMQEVDQLAAGLHRLGFKTGDRIGIWGPSTYEWVLTQFATARIGAILVNVNPAYQVQELEHALISTGMKAVITAASFKTQDYYGMLKELSPELSSCAPSSLKSKRIPELSTVIIMGQEKFPGALRFDDVLQTGNSADIAEVQNISRRLEFDDPINIQFTSGTTGNPKGAVLSHHNVVNNIRYIGERMGYNDHHHRITCQVPLYHCFGMVGGPMSLAAFGSCVVFPSTGYDPAATLRSLQDEKCNVVYGTPTMYIDMCSHPDVGKYDYSSVEKGIMAGSPCPAEVITKSDKVFNAKITVAYGTTENSPVTFMNYLDDTEDRRTETVGRVAAFTEVKVVNEHGQIVPVNSPGEIWIRGYCVMKGYWGQDDKTAEAITKDGWYRTGDVGTLDEQGYARIVGRTKDMIIRGGENIFPTEVEDLLYTMKKIDNVQVFGVPDKRMGEELAAWISLRNGETATEEEIKSFCKGKISHFKIPRYIKFVDEFPLTVTRKVQKFKMRETYAKELGLQE